MPAANGAQRQAGLLLPEHPIRVLLLRANDLRFGAVPHLFVRLRIRHRFQNLRLRLLQMVKSRNGVG